jgi:hypothetical protein
VERFILRFKGNGDSPVDDLERIRTLPDLKVVDDSSRMVLVEAPQEVVTKLVETLPEWSLSRERFVPVPDVRPKLRGS